MNNKNCPACGVLMSEGTGNHFTRNTDKEHLCFLDRQKTATFNLYDSGSSMRKIANHPDIFFGNSWIWNRIKEVYTKDEIQSRRSTNISKNSGMKMPEMRDYFSKNATKQYEDQKQRDIRSENAKRLWQTPEWRDNVMSPELMSKRALQIYINNPSLKDALRKRMIETRKSQPTKVSKIESIMKIELLRRGVDFIHQFTYEMGIADFLIKPNIIIECDGDYWHNIPKVKARDKLKNRYLKENGYKVFRVWEHEIHADIIGCVDSIMDMTCGDG